MIEYYNKKSDDRMWAHDAKIWITIPEKTTIIRQIAHLGDFIGKCQ